MIRFAEDFAKKIGLK